VRTRTVLGIVLSAMLGSAVSLRAADVAAFNTDAERDRWLCDHSAMYSRVAAEIKARKDIRGIVLRPRRTFSADKWGGGRLH